MDATELLFKVLLSAMVLGAFGFAMRIVWFD